MPGICKEIRQSATGLLLAAAILLGPAARADELVLPKAPIDGGRSLRVVYRFAAPATGTGVMAIKWTDTCGRVVDQRALPVTLAGSAQIAFVLDLRRACAMRNELRVHLSLDGAEGGGAGGHRESDARAAFVIRPERRGWPDYQVIMWQPQTAAQYRTLRALGITAGAVPGDRGGDGSRLFPSRMEPLLDNDLPWYVENIATDFYAAYHRWFPDRPVNWRFAAAHELHRQSPDDPAAFERDPSLSDPVWLARIRERLRLSARTHSPYRPLYYSLGDETGIGDLSIFWDFDVSPDSLAGMRRWLRRRYGSLAALNAQWGTRYRRWDQVMPMLTDAAMRRSDGNFSAWEDFKAWMDAAFAHAITEGTRAVHAGDPGALAAIEGGQIPGWGGYDYARLTRAVDLMELYDGGDNIEIVRSLAPRLVILTTSAASGAAERHAVWRGLLRGGRGVILWDPADGYVRADGTPGERGKAMAPVFDEIGRGLGALLINGRRDWGPVAMLYSPASLRLQWLLDWQPKGEAWSTRSVDASYEDANGARASMEGFSRLFEHMGLEHRVISPELLEGGALRRGGFRLLVLPRVLSLSRREASEIRRFVARGGVLVVDGEAGLFDRHGRRLARPRLAELLRGTPAEAGDGIPFGKGRAISFSPPAAAAAVDATAISRLARILAAAHGERRFTLTDAEGAPATDVETNAFRVGSSTVLALQRDPPAGDDGGGTETVTLALPRPAFVYDLRAGRLLGRQDHLTLPLGPVDPVLLSLSGQALAPPRIALPRRASLGDTVEIRLAAGRPSPLAVLHLDVVDPAGRLRRHYSGNAVARWGAAVRRLPLALNDPAGLWQLRVTDALTGETATAALQVSER